MHADQRTMPRFNLDVPLKIRNLDLRGSFWEHAVLSSNISGGGIYFSTMIQVKMDDRIRLYLVMPEQVFGRPVVRWCCEGRVVHIHRTSPTGEKLGVGLSFQMFAGLIGTRLEATAEQVPLKSWWPRPA
jgi:hypothetical protein